MRISTNRLPTLASVGLLVPLALTAFVFTSATNAQEPQSETTNPTYSGLWETSYGRMRLIQKGSTVSGEYSYTSSSTIAGEIEGSRLTFRYSEGETQGEGWYELAEDGESFHGRWREKGSERWSRWKGTRVHPEKGIIWLVILEAHWETSLAEKEYAFGDMLRSYFTMESAHHVRVRYRTFHDEKDLRRWSREIRYLAEPVALLISTHGTPRGVQVADEVIGAEALADCVRGCHNLEVLHLSGCSMMAGGIPAAIQKSIGPAQKLPITGYTTAVAWDASALADFVYLSMLLIHRMDPVEAVEQTHLLAPFTREERLPGARFQALGLRVLGPGGTSSATGSDDTAGIGRRSESQQRQAEEDTQR
ncbi:hypothetical protein CMO84_09095 [Candidatus Woesearchaeota archaeon]|nr:hypothetical protein [Candidatus Woesearchaeota archaeon]